MEDALRALILGIVQGVTEFLPISSSGHLILVPALLGWEDQGLAFDAGLHLGSVVAVLIYFRRDWFGIAGSLLADLRRAGVQVAGYRFESRLGLYIAAASIPVAVVGLPFADAIEEHTRQPWRVAVALAATAVVFLLVERIARRNRGLDSLLLSDAMLVGFAQVVALVPGVSRSGATISAGMACGLRRDESARFAFLLATPALVGAGIFALNDLLREESADLLPFAIGTLTSFLIGLAAIHWLLRFLRTRGLAPFAAYGLAVAVLTLVIGAVRVF